MDALQTRENPSPFHPGERAVQHAAGVREEAEQRGRRMLSAELTAQQVAFFQALPFVITAHVDANGQPWAGLLTGEPGFIDIDSPSGDCIVDWGRANNPTGLQPVVGDALGLLGIDLATRRRNRLNGTVNGNDEALTITVQQGYGNCPKYITQREWQAAEFAGTYVCSESTGLSDAARAQAVQSDTFFIATTSGEDAQDDETRASAWGADVSHRGGPAGFITAERNTLRFADFPGNNMFNTLGNITQYPACGILLPNFDNGELVQLSARAAILPTEEGREVVLDVLATRHWRNG